MYRLLVLSVFVSGALGQLVKPGICDYTAIGGYVTDLNITGVLGTWNQIALTAHPDLQGECSSLTLQGQYNANGELTGVQATWFEVFNKTKNSHNGSITFDQVVPGLFNLNLPNFLQANFVVQSTNYSDYAIMYSCTTLTTPDQTTGTTGTKAIVALQYHRKAELSSSEQASIKEIADLNPELTGATWKSISHSKTACGNAGITLAIPHVLIILTSLFIGKQYV